MSRSRRRRRSRRSSICRPRSARSTSPTRCAPAPPPCWPRSTPSRAAAPRASQAAAKAAGLDAKRQLQESFWTTLGDTGAAQPLLMLAAALERAKAGDLILAVGYGDGADAIVLRATGRPIPAGQGVARQIEVKRTLPSYGRYARFRKLVRKETVPSGVSSPVILRRGRTEHVQLSDVRCLRHGNVR